MRPEERPKRFTVASGREERVKVEGVGCCVRSFHASVPCVAPLNVNNRSSSDRNAPDPPRVSSAKNVSAHNILSVKTIVLVQRQLIQFQLINQDSRGLRGPMCGSGPQHSSGSAIKDRFPDNRMEQEPGPVL